MMMLHWHHLDQEASSWYLPLILPPLSHCSPPTPHPHVPSPKCFVPDWCNNRTSNWSIFWFYIYLLLCFGSMKGEHVWPLSPVGPPELIQFMYCFPCGLRSRPSLQVGLMAWVSVLCPYRSVSNAFVFCCYTTLQMSACITLAQDCTWYCLALSFWPLWSIVPHWPDGWWWLIDLADASWKRWSYRRRDEHFPRARWT